MLVSVSFPTSIFPFELTFASVLALVSVFVLASTSVPAPSSSDVSVTLPQFLPFIRF